MKVLTIQFIECSSLRVYSNDGKVSSSIYEKQRNRSFWRWTEDQQCTRYIGGLVISLSACNLLHRIAKP